MIQGILLGSETKLCLSAPRRGQVAGHQAFLEVAVLRFSLLRFSVVQGLSYMYAYMYMHIHYCISNMWHVLHVLSLMHVVHMVITYYAYPRPCRSAPRA